MIPAKFTIQGALGILAGMGRDELTVDLGDHIPSDAVTVAIRGDNGSGKSTLMNLALTPWREPQQLHGTLYDEFGDQGLRELEFEHAGRRFRSRIEIKQTAKTKSQKAYLHVHTDDAGWQPVTMPDNTVSDGKTRTYDQCLEWVLGPQSLYYLAAFRAQGAPKLAEYSDPKGLMRDLLALDEPAELRDKAKLVVRELRREYERIRRDADRLTEKGDELKVEQDRAAVIAEALPGLVDAKTAAGQAVAIAKAELEVATSANLDSVKIRRQRQEVEQQIEGAREEAVSRERSAQRDLDAAESRKRTALSDGAAKAKDLDVQLHRARHRKASAENLLSRRVEILRARDDAELLGSEIIDQDRALVDIRNQANELQRLSGEERLIQSRLDTAARDGKQLATKCQELHQRHGFVDQVPCRGVGEYATCPALIEAQQAGAQIQPAEAAVTDKRAEWHRINAELSALTGKKAGLADSTAALQAAERTLSNLRRELEAKQKIAAEASAIASAEKTLSEAEAEIQEVERQIAQAADQLRSRETECDTEIKAQTDRLAEEIEAGRVRVAELQAKLGELPVPEPGGALEAAQNKLRAAEQQAATAAGAVDQNNADLATAKSRAASLRSDIDAGAEITRKAAALSEEIASWTLLSVALQGVIDLSIEDAGPAISATANHLLSEAYGPRFTTAITTQRVANEGKANERLVEVFDIEVIDGQSGIRSSVLQKSGGESVWLDKALTDAVGLYHQDAAGIHYECLFADEAEDGLTQDRKQQFYRMDRAALEMGGYRRKFFVSHNPDAWQMADCVLDVGALAHERT